ncbi:hypothetical protein Noda2021_09920 [Candidatus Dependentiae bacterium Noda2021]|nr:hypothetical protein Noda2021_09920 [Candidatus Dependentiae bacterium Noda2021]
MKNIYSLVMIATVISSQAMEDVKHQLAQHIPTLGWNSFTYTKNELISLQNTLTKLMQTNDALLTSHLNSVNTAITKYLTSITYHPARSLSPARSNEILQKEIYHPLVQLICEIESKTNSTVSTLAQHITQLKWNSHTYLEEEINTLSQTINVLTERVSKNEMLKNLKNMNQAIKKYNENIRYTNFSGGVSPYRLHEIYEKEIYKPLVDIICQSILQTQN